MTEDGHTAASLLGAASRLHPQPSGSPADADSKRSLTRSHGSGSTSTPISLLRSCRTRSASVRPTRRRCSGTPSRSTCRPTCPSPARQESVAPPTVARPSRVGVVAAASPGRRLV